VWTAQGYAVVNADLRGAGTSEGRCDLFSDQEAEDYHDLIEWVGTQPWSSGRVGRELDAVLSTPLQPVHTHRTPERLTPGRPTLVDVALLPHATRLRAGEQLIVELRGTWPFPRDPWRGQFTTGYQRSKKATCTVHTGADRPAHAAHGHAPGATEPCRLCAAGSDRSAAGHCAAERAQPSGWFGTNRWERSLATLFPRFWMFWSVVGE